MVITLKEGDMAPAFTLKDATGTKLSLDSLKGSRVALTFLSADAAAQLAALGQIAPALKKRKIEIVCISTAALQSPFPVLADITHEVSGLYGVWGKKVVDDKTVQGMTHATFLLDEDGKIISVMTDIDPHGEQLMNAFGDRK